MIFKQSFKSRTAPGTPGLNVRHLQYIATRPGAVYNRECGFGLWGQLPGDKSARIQTDFIHAKQIIREASENHTVYRAIVSVGKEDAEQYGLYDRSRWEKLVSDHITDIAREMEIKPETLRWCASFHYAVGHPHVHILYWDSSTEPRREYIPPEKWEAKAERIRAAFAGDIHREEIREAQKAQREQISPLRQAVLALCREACPERGLNMVKILNGSKLEEIARQMDELIRAIPEKGSLRYAYLPPAYKETVDKLVDTCLEIPEIQKELQKYEAYSKQISELYGNGENSENIRKALEKLRHQLCNSVMDAIREIRTDLQSERLQSPEEYRRFLQNAVQEITPELPSYAALQTLLPPERVPLSCMRTQIPGYREAEAAVAREILQDARVRLRIQGYAMQSAGVEQIPAYGTEEREAYQEAYREAQDDLKNAIREQVREDAGWTNEGIRTGSLNMLAGMMRIVSQSAGQQKAAAAQASTDRRLRSKDRSREAKRDQAAEQASAEWDTW